MVRSTRRAMRLCRFRCSTAMAISSPPKNRTLVSLKYWMQTWWVGTTERQEDPGVFHCAPGLTECSHQLFHRGWSLGSWNRMEMVFGLPAI